MYVLTNINDRDVYEQLIRTFKIINIKNLNFIEIYLLFNIFIESCIKLTLQYLNNSTIIFYIFISN